MLWQIGGFENAAWRKIEALASQGDFGIGAPELVFVGVEIGSRNLAFDDDRAAAFLPTDGVGHFSGAAGLLTEDDAASVAAEPCSGNLD